MADMFEQLVICVANRVQDEIAEVLPYPGYWLRT